MRWLITGGCGFIGANLVADLLSTGEHEVRLLDDSSAGADSLRALGIDAAGLDIHEADVRDDAALLAAARGADAVVHLAGATGVAGSLADPRADATANVLGTLNVLEGARQTGARVVLASTTGPLVGECARIDEHTLPAPNAPYGASKLAAEAYCQAYAGAFGVDSCVLRLTNVYGPGSGHKTGAVGRFLADGLAGRALTITGDGQQARDFVYVADIVRALRLAATHPAAAGHTFQIGTGHATAIATLAGSIQDLLQSRGHARPALSFAPARPAEVRSTPVSPAKAKTCLGWYPTVELADGLARTYSALGRAFALSDDA